jgi:hypothetical protein
MHNIVIIITNIEEISKGKLMFNYSFMGKKAYVAE